MIWLKEYAPWVLGILAILSLIFIVYLKFFSSKPIVKHYIYKATPQGKLQLQVHFPRNWTKNDRRPAILFFFGGGWVSGELNQFLWLSNYLAKRGMVAIRADYRVDSRHHTTPNTAVEDGIDALKWLNHHGDELGINPQKIVSSGNSAGGHIAACLSLCNLQPPHELTANIRPSLLALFNPVLDLTNASPELEFSRRELELIKMMPNHVVNTISPNQHIDSHLPSSLLIFGDKDPLRQQGDEFRRKALEYGVMVKTVIAADQKHGFFNKEPWRSATTLALDNFLIETGHLSGDPLPPEESISNAELSIF